MRGAVSAGDAGENPTSSSTPEAGWYPDPGQPATQRYWDGTDWTDQRAPLEPPGAGLDRSLGAGLALIGAAVMLVSVFLPMGESSTYAKIVQNTMIQHTEGWILIVLSLCAAAAAVRRLQGEGRSWTLVVIGLLGVGFAIYVATNGLELSSTGPTDQMDLSEALGALSRSEKADPGVGIYAAGVGGLMVAAGGYMLRSGK